MGRRRAGSGDGEDARGEDAHGGVAVAEVGAEGGVDAACRTVVEGALALGRCCRPAYVIAPGAAKLIAPGAAKLIVPGRPN